MKCYHCGSEETVLFGFGDYPNATWRCRRCGRSKEVIPWVICGFVVIAIAYILSGMMIGK